MKNELKYKSENTNDKGKEISEKYAFHDRFDIRL